MNFERIIAGVAMGIEVAGVGVIVAGGLLATAAFLSRLLRRDALVDVYRQYRADLGRAILLGLEFLVAADIIGTVTAEPTFRSLGVLALIVVIRTFLSFVLELEINGRWPWQSRGSIATS